MKLTNMPFKATPLVLALAVANAYAQTAPTAPPPEAPAAAAAAADASAQEAKPAIALQEVVVTATRRSANLQKVPATVDVVSSDTVKQLNILSVEDMQGLVPGVTIVRNAGSVPFIRGVGTNNSGFTTETAVGMYIDGLYLANAASGMFGFNNIERVEVLKGPQGTLYGRNTTGGLINVITRDPEARETIDTSVSYESYNKKTLNFYGSTPLSDTLSANISVMSTDQGRGWGHNLMSGADVMKDKLSGMQLKLQWKPMAGTKVTLRLFGNYLRTDNGVSSAILPGTVASDGTPYLGEYNISTRRAQLITSHQFNGALKVEHDLGFANLLSISGYQHNKSPTEATLNGTPGAPVTGQSAVESYLLGENKAFSQELQLSSKPSASPLDWLGGVFYYNNVDNLLNDLWATCIGQVCAGAPVPTMLRARPTTISASIYADGTYTIRPGTRLTAGVRYTQDKKGMTGTVTALQGFPNSIPALPPSVVQHFGDAFAGNPTGIPTETTFSKTTFRAAIAQDLSQRVQTYASFNRGFKAGGYNPGTFSNPVSRPETLDATEIGLKAEMFQRRVRFNVAAFNYKYTDIQLRSTAPPAPPGGTFLTNAAGARVKGLDVDFKVAVTENLQLMGGFEYLDAYYTSFPGGTCSSPRPIGNGVLGGVITVPCDLSGHALINSPKFSSSLGVSYSIDVPSGSLMLTANDAYKSKYAFSSDGAPFQNAYHDIRASLLWKSPDDRYDVQLFGKNLAGAYYYSSAIGPVGGNYTYTPGAPRTFGVTLGYHM